MAHVNNQGGQRKNLSSGTGRKERSPTSHGQTGSRADPSHTNEQKKEDRVKKAVPAATKPAEKGKPKKEPGKKSASKKP